MRAGRALRDQWAADKAWATLCPNGCGHSIMEHRNHQPTRQIVGFEIVETPHPEFHPLRFKCDRCECVMMSGEKAEA